MNKHSVTLFTALSRVSFFCPSAKIDCNRDDLCSAKHKVQQRISDLRYQLENAERAIEYINHLS